MKKLRVNGNQSVPLIKRTVPLIARTTTAVMISTLFLSPRSARSQDLGEGVEIAAEIMNSVAPVQQITELPLFVDRDPNEALLVLRYGNGEIHQRPFVGSYGPPGKYDEYKEFIKEASEKYGLPIALIDAVIRTESGYRPGVCSHKNACGLMQMIPSTARAMGVTDRKDPRQSIMGGTQYLRYLYDRFGSVPLAIAAYNGGPGAIKNGGIHPAAGYNETRGYVPAVLGRYYASSLDKSGAEDLKF